jgi:hypothetical protein
MRPALDPAGHRVPQTKPTCLLHTWRPHRRRPFLLVLHLHQHQSSRNLRLQYLAKNQSTQSCQPLITPGSDHPPVLEPHMVLRSFVRVRMQGEITLKGGKDQGATTDHPRGLRRKVQTSCEKPPYLDCEDDDLKMTQMKGGQVKNVKMSRGEKNTPKSVQKQAGPTGLVGSAQALFASVRCPL